ncbi:MAG: hypothetical protein M1836_001255 [Candelina mexicana]|nr:MAG: hypothetical protein M1836_001255 [Candelina mexicana]
MTDSDHFSPYRPDGKLYGFVCIVTGAAQPVGSAIVHELATCSNSSGEDYSPLESKISKDHPNTKIIGYPYSPSNEEDTLGLIDDVLNAWGRLDVWVCSSGLLGPAAIQDTTPTDMQKCFEANSMVPFFALKYGPPAMAKTTPKGSYPNAAPKDQKYGSIVVVSSVASTYGGTGVRINCISPGQIDVGVSLQGVQKENIGLERAGMPEEVARVAGFLASGFSSYVSGANLVVDGGASTMCPLTIPI